VQSRQGSAKAHGNLFHAVAQEIGLEVRTITGEVRGSVLRGAHALCTGECEAHVWNAVLLAEGWVLIDCFSGARTVEGDTQQMRPHFFATPPKEACLSNFPDDSEWQLLATPMRRQDFLAQPAFSIDNFLGLGLALDSECAPLCSIVLDRSSVGALSLRVPDDVSLHVTLDGEETRCLQVLELGDQGDRGTAVLTVRFRIPSLEGDTSPQEHKLEIFSRLRSVGEVNTDSDAYKAACTMVVKGVGNSCALIEPVFPRMNYDDFRELGLRFHEALPDGHLVLRESDIATVELLVASDIAVTAELRPADGGDVIEAHVDRVDSERIVIQVRCPFGEHRLCVRAGRVVGSEELREVVFYSISMAMEQTCEGSSSAHEQARDGSKPVSEEQEVPADSLAQCLEI